VNKKLKGGAIYIALVILLLSTTISFAFLIITYNQQQSLHQLISFQERLYDLESGLNILLNDASIPESQPHEITLFEKNKERSVTLLKNNWGVYKRYSVCIETEQKICQNYLVGYRQNNFPALYIQDRRDVFTIDHRSTILGTMYLPKARYETYYTSSRENKKTKNSAGIFASNAKLPAIEIKVPQAASTLDGKLVENAISHSFDEKTLQINCDKTLGNISLEGNVIVQGSSSIFIASNCQLNDVIVKADSVIIGSNFEGAVQVFASKYIEVQQNTRLMYPSALVMQGAGVIKIDQGAYLFGACISQNTSSKIHIDKQVSLGGLIYSSGKIEMHSDLFGSLYASETYFQNRSGTFENYLIDVDLLQSTLDSRFLYPTVMQTEDVQKGVIKKLL
jgi:hypothetical protein